MENQKKGCISMVEANLPPGFRFHPRDDELVCDYLLKRFGCSRGRDRDGHHTVLLIDVDLNKCEPWDLPQTACVGGKEWYFYNQRDRKYTTGLRTNRATATGYWKATGKDRAVLRKGSLVGMRKTLVFYRGRAPKGRKTDWVMHEFRHEGPFAPSNDTSLFHKEDWVLCRVFQKNKEVGNKDSMRSSSDETGSSSLPPLMDSYINFNQSDHQEPSSYLNEDNIIHEQVPCFSILSQNQNQTDPVLPNLSGLVSDVKIPSKNPNPLSTGSAPSPELDSFCYDQMVLRALLSQITKIDGNLDPKESQCFGEGSSESVLTGIGIPSTIWN